MMMIHDPMTIAMGNIKDFEKAISVLEQVKQSIVNAYHTKSGLSRSKISEMMSDETWLYARDAVKLGLADDVLFDGRDESDEPDAPAAPEEVKENEKEPPVSDLIVPTIYATRAMGRKIISGIVHTTGNGSPITDTHTLPAADEPARTDLVDEPSLDLTGKTKDGSMSYSLLMEKLILLR